MKAIDLFAGAGGFSMGAKMAGIEVVWAANHWPDAVEWHSNNHPDTQHICQDLHQADWSKVPSHDILLASPCCQGHSKARGKKKSNAEHDASRSTAWAVISALEFHKPSVAVVENVKEFLDWSLYNAWSLALKALGYSVSVNIIDAADFGAPQNRQRMFLVLSRSQKAIKLNLKKQDEIPSSSFIDFEAGKWQPIFKPGRAIATLKRIDAGRKQHGDRFLISYYGNTKNGRSLNRPIGTITTRDRWAIIDGDKMRILSRFECRDAMSFPNNYLLPENHRLAVHLMGNAVCPVPVMHLLNAIQESA
jgi:DNA (cytosine-5)-methyltransferase 1